MTLTERLARCYTGAIHDVLRAMGNERCVLPHSIRPLDPSIKVAGPVWTVSGHIDRFQPVHDTLLGWTTLLSNDRQVTLAVALGNFLAADDSPWELLMTTGLIYALPPAAIYYTFKRYMVSGLTSGAVKS